MIPRRPDAKIFTWKRLQSVVRRLRAQGRRIVFTNGCFDLLHAGHALYLNRARRLGDCLIVGVNTDASVRRLKGPGRPVVPQRDRLRVLAALESVDYVVPFGGATPERLIEMIRPAWLVKGADWTTGRIVGAKFVGSYGGRVARVPLLPGRSTSGLLKQMKLGMRD